MSGDEEEMMEKEQSTHKEVSKKGMSEEGLELGIRGNGVMRKAWEDMSIGNHWVRTSGSLGSPRHTKTRTTSCYEFPSKSAIPPVARRPFRSQKAHSTAPSHSLRLLSPGYRMLD